jgi:hypothetical protein
MRKYFAYLVPLIMGLAFVVSAAPASAHLAKQYGHASGKVNVPALTAGKLGGSNYFVASTLRNGVMPYIYNHYDGYPTAWSCFNYHSIWGGQLKTGQFQLYVAAYRNHFYGGWFMGQGRVADNGDWQANWSY